MKSFFAERVPKAMKAEELRGWIEADLKQRAALEQAQPSDPFTAPEIAQPDDSIVGQLPAGVGSTISNWMNQIPAQMEAEFFGDVAKAGEEGVVTSYLKTLPQTLLNPAGAIKDQAEVIGSLFMSEEEATAKSLDAAGRAVEAGQETQREYPLPPSARRFYEGIDGESFLGSIPSFFRSVVEEPTGASQMALRLIGQMGPGLAGAAIVGYTTKNPTLASAFLGLQSGVMERYLEPVDFMISKGMDPADPQSIKAFISDPKMMEEARQAGFTRGAIIGTLDFLSGKLATVSLAKNPITNTAIQMPLQAGFGAGAEAGAQAFTRDEMDWRDVTLEFFGEFLGAPLEVRALASGYVRAKGLPKTDINMEEVWEDAARGDEKAVAVLKAGGMSQEMIDQGITKRRPKVIQETVQQIKEYGDEIGTNTVELRQTAIEEGQKKLADSIGASPTVEVKLPPKTEIKPPKKPSKRQSATPAAPTSETPATGSVGSEIGASQTDPTQSTLDISAPTTVADATAEQLAQLQTELFGKPTSIREMNPEQRALYELERDRRYPPVPIQDYDFLGAGQTTFQSQPFIDWFKKSAAVTEENVPQPYYHGTGADIRAFGGARSASISGQEGPFFLSPSPEFADEFARINQSAGGGGKPREKGANILPVYVSVQKPYDFDRLEDVETVEAEVRAGVKSGEYSLRDIFGPKRFAKLDDELKTKTVDQLLDEQFKKLTFDLPTGVWWTLELPAVQKAIRKLGYDGFYVKEAETKNLAVFSPTQIKSVFNRGTFSSEDPNIDAMAGKKDRFIEGGEQVPDAVEKVSSLEEMFKQVKGKVFDTGRNFKLFMQGMVNEAAAGVDLTIQNYENQQHLMRMAIKDALYALKSNANAVGWYDKTVTKALKVLATIHPEIATDPDAKFAFTFALAVTSNGLKVNKNFELAETAYQSFKDNGKMPTDIGIGTAAKAINTAMENFNLLVEKYGKDDARALMMTHFTVSQLRKLGLDVDGEDANTVVRGAAYIGPKIGNGFFSNLNGTFDALTIDRWLMRTWGRWTGNLVNVRQDKAEIKAEELQGLINQMNDSDIEAFREATGVNLKSGDIGDIAVALKAASQDPETREKMSTIGAKRNEDGKPIGDWVRRAANSLWGYLDGQIEMPETSQREYIRNTLGAALKWLQANGYEELTMADLQAVLWYGEKRVYDGAKAKLMDDEDAKQGYVEDETPDYANAAILLARDKGVKEEKIQKAKKEAELEYAAKVSTGRAGRGEAGSQEAGKEGGSSGDGGRERAERLRLLKRWVFQEDRHRREGDGKDRAFRSGSLGRNNALGRVKARYETIGKFNKVLQASEIRVPEAFYELAPQSPEVIATVKEGMAKAQKALADAKAKSDGEVAKAREAISKAKSDSAKKKATERLAKAEAEGKERLSKAEEAIAKAQSKLDYATLSHANQFRDAIAATKQGNKYGAAVFVYDTADYAGMRLFLTEDKKNGFALKPDGDIVSVFSSGGGTVHAMMELAVEEGGTKLDAFDTVLPELYAYSDFVEVGRDPWNDEYKPEDWDYNTFKRWNNGRPDIVYMEYRPVAVKSSEPSVDTDEDAEGILPRASGAQLTGARQRTGGIPSTGQNDTYNATLTQIHENFIALLNLVVRQGSVTAAGGQALGQHTQSNGVIRLKDMRDFEVLVHEAGHAMHSDKGPALTNAINGNLHGTELAGIARAYYGGNLTNATRDKILREGFAEFFRLYMTNKGEAMLAAPNFYQAFENIMGADPQLLESIRTIRSQYERLFDLSSVAFGKSFLVSGVDEGFFAKMKRGISEQGIIGYLKTGLAVHAHHAYVGVIDKAGVFTRLRSELQNIEDKNKSGLIHDLLRSEDPRVLYEMAQRTSQVAVDELYHGITDLWGRKNTSASLRDALARMHDVPADANVPMDPTVMEDFNNYLVAKTVLEDETNPDLRARKDKPTAPYNAADAQQIVTELEAKYGVRIVEASEMIYDFNRALWKKMRDAGLLNDQQYQDGLVRRNYVPLLRDMSKTVTGSSAKKNALTSGETKIVKQRNGSARDILFPLESIMTMTMSVERSIAQNRVKVALAQMADRAGRGGGAFVERIPDTQVAAIEAPIMDVVNNALKNSGLSTQDQDAVRTIMESVYDETSKTSFFRSQIKMPGVDGDHIMFFWEGGKRKAMVIGKGDDLTLAQEVFAAMDALGPDNFGALVDVLSLTSAVQRTAITSWFDFLGVNYIRDQLSAAMLTDVGYIPFFSGVKGAWHILRQSDVARDYLIGGGSMGGVNTAALEAIQTKKDISILKRKGYAVQILGSDKMGSFTGLAKALTHLSELIEGATRVGLYEKAYKRGIAEGLTHEDAMVEASYLATDYINFGRHGSAKSYRLVSRIVPFFNAQIQGLDKMARTMFGDEVASRKGIRFALKAYFKDINGIQGLTRIERQQLKNGRKLWVKMAMVGMLGAALSLMFKGDPDYEEASPYIKSRHWVVPLGNGKVFLIPKPFELAIVNNVFEAAIESDGASLDRFLEGLQMTLTPPMQNPLIKYIYEVATNYDTFRDRPLVPTWMQTLPPTQQVHEHTSTVAKKIGEAIGVSPIYVEHFVTSIGASAGRDLMAFLDGTDPNRPAKGWDETPILRRFIRETRKGGNTVQEFYGQMSEFNGTITQAGAGYKKLMDRGSDMKANIFLDNMNEEQKAWAILNYNWDASYKRMHPGYRTNQIAEVLTGLKKELYLPVIKDAKGDEITLTAGQKTEITEAVNDILHREMRNYLVGMKVPGWQDKTIMPVEPSYDILREISPEIGDLLDAKIAKQKIYDFDIVMQNWPEVKEALVGDREYAELDNYLRDFGVKPKRRKRE